MSTLARCRYPLRAAWYACGLSQPARFCDAPTHRISWYGAPTCKRHGGMLPHDAPWWMTA